MVKKQNIRLTEDSDYLYEKRLRELSHEDLVNYEVDRHKRVNSWWASLLVAAFMVFLVLGGGLVGFELTQTYYGNYETINMMGNTLGKAICDIKGEQVNGITHNSEFGYTYVSCDSVTYKFKDYWVNNGKETN